MRAVRVVAVDTMVAILVLAALLPNEVIAAHAANVVAAVAAVLIQQRAAERVLRRRTVFESSGERAEVVGAMPESSHNMQP